MADTEPSFTFPSAKKKDVAPAANPNEPAFVLPVSRSARGRGEFKTRTAAEEKETAGARAALLRGASFGLSDRASALLSPGDYKTNLEKNFADRDEYNTAHPWMNLANEGLGGLATGGGIVRGAGKLAEMVAPSAVEYAAGTGLGPLLTRAASGLGLGAAIGETASQAQKPYDKVGSGVGTGALYGAGAQAVGTVLAKAAGMTLSGMSKIGQRVAMAVGAVRPEDFAARKYIESLAAKGLSPEDITVAVKKLRGDDLAQQGPVSKDHTLPNNAAPAVVADVVPKTTLNVFNKGVKSSDVGTDQMEQAMRDRSLEQLGRVENTTANTLSGDMNATANVDQHIAAGRAAAKPHYDAAYSVGTPSDPRVLAWINDSPANSQLFRKLEANLEQHASKGLNDSKPMTAKLGVNPDGTFRWDKYPSIEDLDTIKKYIDAQRNDLWDTTKNTFRLAKPGNSTAEQLGTQRDDIVNLIDSLTPDGNGGSHYANARKAFAEEADLRDAHEKGRQVMRTRPEDVDKAFSDLGDNPQMQDQYRAGMASVVKDIIDKSGPGGPALIKKLYGTPGIQQKIESVMANPATNDQFARSMAAEKAFTDTQRVLAPKAGGQDLLGDSTGFSLPLAVANTAVGRMGAAAGNLGKFASGMISNMAPDVGEELTRIALMSPEEHSDWLRMYRASQNTASQKAIRAMGQTADYIGDGAVPSLDSTAGSIPKQSDNDQQ